MPTLVARVGLHLQQAHRVPSIEVVGVLQLEAASNAHKFISVFLVAILTQVDDSRVRSSALLALLAPIIVLLLHDVS